MKTKIFLLFVILQTCCVSISFTEEIPVKRETSAEETQPQTISKSVADVLELTTIANLRNVYVAATIYSNQKGSAPSDLQQLIQEELLPKEFGNSTKGRYLFQMKSSGSHFEVNADPVDSRWDLKHFYIDEKGNIHFEKGKPATAESSIRNPAEI